MGVTGLPAPAGLPALAAPGCPPGAPAGSGSAKSGALGLCLGSDKRLTLHVAHVAGVPAPGNAHPLDRDRRSRSLRIGPGREDAGWIRLDEANLHSATSAL